MGNSAVRHVRTNTETRDRPLHVSLVPSPVPATPPDLSLLHSLHLDSFHYLDATIEGAPVTLFVDSSVTHAILSHKTAKRLGLLDRSTVSFSAPYTAWKHHKKVGVRVVRKVKVVLGSVGDSVELMTTFYVFEEGVEVKDCLDNTALWECKAIQAFTRE